MPEAYSWEIRERAEELYVVEGLTYEQVAEATGVSVSQLQRWASESEWTDRKKEYRQALSNIKRDTVLLRQRLIKKALGSLDAQDVYAISSLENVAAKAAKTAAESSQVTLQELRDIKTPQDAIDALQEAVERRINGMLTQPGTISLGAVKEMKQAMELIESMKAKYKPEEEAAAGGLSDEAADEIRRKILGLS